MPGAPKGVMRRFARTYYRRLCSLKYFLLISVVLGWSCSARAQTPNWVLVWADEFSESNGSPPNPNNWGFDLGGGGWGNNELEYYTKRTNNARIENGHLVIEARQENYGGRNYTSARLLTQTKWSWTYGRVEARIQIPRGQGIWPAFWMLGTNISSVSWPTCGEIDIMENIGREPGMVHGTAHGPGYSGSAGIGGPYALPGNAAFADGFHVFAIEWQTNRIRWFVDDEPYFSLTPNDLPAGSSWVFQAPQFVLLNVAVGGLWPGNPDGTTTFPQQMLVDYVRVYTAADSPTCGGENVLTNPGFEFSGLANWKKYGTDFNTQIVTTDQGATVHSGSNAFKVFGQFNSGENYSGVYQDLPCWPGQAFTARGWALTPGNDQITLVDGAWIEISFRDGGANILDIYRTAIIDPSAPTGVWMNLEVTNQLNITNFAVIGSAMNLVAPVGTEFVRYQVVFRQTQNGSGSVWFDDLALAGLGSAQVSVAATARNGGDHLDLTFPSFLGRTYEIRYKDSLRDPDWLLLTTVIGNGTTTLVSDPIQLTQRYYQVQVVCN